jgi:hypothetical protein
MSRFLATCVLTALGTVCAFAQEKVESKDDPKSDNKGKILGKWKILEAPGFDADLAKALEAQKIYAYIEFTAKGACTIGVTSDDPDVKKTINAAGEKTAIGCKYKLLAGDGLEMYDLPKELADANPFGGKGDRAKTKVKIDGDKMTMTDDDGKTGKLVRIKEPKKDKEKDNPKD